MLRVRFHFEPAQPLHGSCIIISNLQMIFNFLRPSTVKRFAQSHKTCKTWNWSLDPGAVSVSFSMHISLLTGTSPPLLTGIAHYTDTSYGVLPADSGYNGVSQLITSSRLAGTGVCRHPQSPC